MSRRLPVRGPVSRPGRLPSCPGHLNPAAAAEWRRVAKALQRAGVLTAFDRAALAAYCQAWGRWVEAEEKLKATPILVRTPSGYVQQSPWLSIAHRQLELMGRYMVELGLTPAARSRVAACLPAPGSSPVEIRLNIVRPDPRALEESRPAATMDARALPAKHGGD